MIPPEVLICPRGSPAACLPSRGSPKRKRAQPAHRADICLCRPISEGIDLRSVCGIASACHPHYGKGGLTNSDDPDLPSNEGTLHVGLSPEAGRRCSPLFSSRNLAFEVIGNSRAAVFVSTTSHRERNHGHGGFAAASFVLRLISSATLLQGGVFTIGALAIRVNASLIQLTMVVF